MFKTKKEPILAAALALREERALYSELCRRDGGYALIHADEFDLPPGLIENDSIRDGAALGRFLRRACGGRWRALPLALGIPSSSCVYAPLELPVANTDEAVSALSFSFHRFFPYSVENALYGLSPSGAGAIPGQLRFLGTACDRAQVVALVEALCSFRSRVDAVEPQCAAALRALTFREVPELDADDYDHVLMLYVLDSTLCFAYLEGDRPVWFHSYALAAAEAGTPDQLAGAVDREIADISAHVLKTFAPPTLRIALAGEWPFDRSLFPSLRAAIHHEPWLSKHLNFDEPSAPDWADVVGLLLRQVHSEPFNLLPPEYDRRASSGYRIRLGLAATAMGVCAAVFFGPSLYLLPKWRAQAAKAASDLKIAEARAQLWSRQAEGLQQRRATWQTLLDEALATVSALPVMTLLGRALPPAARIESLSVDRHTLKFEVSFADTMSVDSFVRKLSVLPYAPVQTMERRTLRHGGVYARFLGNRP